MFPQKKGPGQSVGTLKTFSQNLDQLWPFEIQIAPLADVTVPVVLIDAVPGDEGAFGPTEYIT